jgi:hypothetical protein
MRKIIARLNAELGRYGPVVEYHARTLALPHALVRVSRVEAAIALHELYREAGQLDDLRKIVAAIEAKRRTWLERTWERRGKPQEGFQTQAEILPIRALLRIRDLGVLGEIDKLVEICRDRDPPFDDRKWFQNADPYRREAARALARCGDAVLPAIEKALDGRGDDREWFVHALGLHPNVEAATAILRRIASEEEGTMQELAEEALQRIEKGEPVGDPGTGPKPGSLPKEVDLE